MDGKTSLRFSGKYEGNSECMYVCLMVDTGLCGRSVLLVSVTGECAGRSRWGAACGAVAILSLPCQCFGPCFPSVGVVASRGAHAALTEVFPESESQAAHLACMR